jgi:hypothetical protein
MTIDASVVPRGLDDDHVVAFTFGSSGRLFLWTLDDEAVNEPVLTSARSRRCS